VSTHTLYDVAAGPEYIRPLREEIQAITATDSWSKAALDKMAKLGSLLRESIRCHGVALNLLTLKRMAMKDITLIDGTYISKGTLLAATAHPM
ncbi:hypothetical protein DICSQDRAFT_24778, partial [Dichomitus squalens LYAD-421 SS1]